jgi:hypothetical protein
MEVTCVVVAIFIIVGTAIAIWQRAVGGQNLLALYNKMEQLVRQKQVEVDMKAKNPPCHHEWDTLKEERMQNTHEQQYLLILQCKFCGVLDKTCQAIKLPEPKSECRHNWERQKATTLESAYEQIAENFRKKEEPDPKNFEPWMFRKTYINSRICTRCGEISTIVASNFEIEEE